jgi:hypothetical protein
MVLNFLLNCFCTGAALDVFEMPGLFQWHRKCLCGLQVFALSQRVVSKLNQMGLDRELYKTLGFTFAEYAVSALDEFAKRQRSLPVIVFSISGC